MGRKGGKVRTPKGFSALTPAQRSEVGKAAAAKRSAALTPERRSQIAKAAADKRWAGKKKAMTETQIKLGGIRVNGRVRYFNHVSNLRRVGKSQWTIERHGVEFRVEGGRHAGGTSRQWYLDGGFLYSTIRCTSLMAALRMLEEM